MLESLKVEFFLDGRDNYLFGKRCLQELYLLALQVLSPILEVILKIFFAFVLIYLGVVAHSSLADHDLTVDSFRTILFLVWSACVTVFIVVFIRGRLFLPFLLHQFMLPHLNVKRGTLPRSILSRR